MVVGRKENVEITLEDVESAIRVLSEFYRIQNQAKRVLRQLGVREGYHGGGLFNPEQLMRETMDRIHAEREGDKEPLPELTEDDLERMRQITEKRREKSEHKAPSK